MLSWSDEMNQLLTVFDRQVKCSLGKIKKALKRDGLSLNAEFGQYFLRVSNERIKYTYDEFTIISMYEDRALEAKSSAIVEYRMNSTHTPSYFMNNTQSELSGPVKVIESSDEEEEEEDRVKLESFAMASNIQNDDYDIPPELNYDTQIGNDGSDIELPDMNPIEEMDSGVKAYGNISMSGFDFQCDMAISNESTSTETLGKGINALDNRKIRKLARSARKSDSNPTSSYQSISSNQMQVKKQFKCQICEYSNNYKCHLKRHMRKHTGEKPYRCDICPKEFTQLGHMKRHKVTHTDEIPFHCRGCLTEFSQKADQESHEKVCKSRRYECHICKKCVTADKNDLKRHMRTHNGEKPFRCEICMMRFTVKSSLKRHSDIIHTNC